MIHIFIIRKVTYNTEVKYMLNNIFYYYINTKVLHVNGVFSYNFTTFSH